MTLNKEQKKELAQLRKLYSSNNWANIRKSISQIMESNDEDLIKLLSDGISFDMLNRVKLSTSSEIHTKVKLAWRIPFALFILRKSGRIDGVKELNIPYQREMLSLDWLYGANSLEILKIEYAFNLVGIEPLSSLKKIEQLVLYCCKSIKDIEPVGKCKTLRSFGIESSPLIKRIDSISNLKNLEVLNLSNCTSIADISPIAKLKKIKGLSLKGLKDITDLSTISGLKSITSLNISEMLQVNSLSPLTKLPELAVLNITGCTNIADLKILKKNTSLKMISYGRNNFPMSDFDFLKQYIPNCTFSRY